MTTAPHPLHAHLAFAVPLAITELRAQGGPTEYDHRQLRLALPKLLEQGDVLLFGGHATTGSPPRELVNLLVRALAMLAFQPGGVKAFGEHWEAHV